MSSPVRTAYKYPLAQPGSAIVHDMPVGAVFACVAIQEWETAPAQMWWVVDPDTATEPRTFALVGTGMRYEDGAADSLRPQGAYLGTVHHAAS